MAIITFVNRDLRETGQSFSVGAIATVMAIEHNYKILIISTDFNDHSLEESFFKQNKSFNFNSILNMGRSDKDVSSGVEGLIRTFASNRVSVDMLKSYTKPVLKDRLDILSTLKTTEISNYINLSSYFSQIADVANATYDMVFVDLSRKMPKEMQNRVLNLSDMIVTGVSQNSSSIMNFYKLRAEDPIFQSKKVLLSIGKYDESSKFNYKNISRTIKQKNGTLVVPYSINFSDHCSDGKIVDYCLMARMMDDKTNKEYKFYDIVKNSVEKIDYKLKELQYEK